MLPKSLKKLILRKDGALIASVIEAMDPALCVKSAEGSHLLGNLETVSTEDAAHRAAITLEQETIGWVCGSPKATIAAELLTKLATRELEKRTITQELLDKYKEITLLFRLSEQILETLDVHESARLVLKEAQQILPSDSGMLMLLHENTGTLETIAHFTHYADGQPPVQVCQLDEGIIGTIARLSRGEIVNNITTDERDTGESALQAQGCRTLICVPLKIKERLIGVIALIRQEAKPYRAEDLKLLTALCAHAAGVISVLRNENQLKESRQNELIFELSGQIRDSLSLSETLTTAVQKIQATLRSDRCFFLWHRSAVDINLPTGLSDYRPAEEHLAIVSEAKNPSLSSIMGIYDIDEVDRNLLTPLYAQEIIKIDNVRELELTPLSLFLQSSDCMSLLAVPLMTRAGQVGLLCCGSSQPRVWDTEEIKLLEAVTTQMVIAIDQAELYEKSHTTAQLAKDRAQELEQALNHLQTVQLQLIQTEKMSSLGRMVAGIAHEINNPITFIHGNVSHLQKGLLDLLDLVDCYQRTYPQDTPEIVEISDEIDLIFLQDDLPKLLDSINTGTERIREIVLSLQNFTRHDQAEMKPVDLHEGLDSTLHLLQHRFKVDARDDSTEEQPVQRMIALVRNYGTLPQVSCHAKQLNQVFMNVLSNALDALDTSDIGEATVPTITVTTEYKNQQATIRIADNGPGIPENAKAHLFDPFFTTKEVGQGKGLGLSMSYQIVTSHHRGTLECHSKLGEGTEFVISIPVQEATDTGPAIESASAYTHRNRQPAQSPAAIRSAL
ncbi:MAG: GAF domain-containing protein [Cyanobacteria bacterium J06649_4]